MITSEPTHCDLVAVYEQMQAEGLLDRVLVGGWSLEDLEELAGRGNFFIERHNGEIAFFWWLTHFYHDAWCFHGCAFKQYRRQALARLVEYYDIFACNGITDLYAFSQTRDVALFLRRAGFNPVSSIDKEIQVWAVNLKTQ